MKNPWLKFYPSDWRGDAGLRQCSYAARGLWMDLISIMHEAEPYGHLIVNGKAPDARRIAAMLGGAEKHVAAMLAELEDAGVFSRDDDGTIYSRRMVRDNQKAERDLQRGKAGGNPNIERGTVPKEERVRPFKRTDAPAKTDRIFSRSGGKCHWCGIDLSRDEFGPNFFHVDHVIPVRDGGTNDESNLVASCAACNHKRARKGWRHDDPTAPGLGSDDEVGISSDNKAQILEARYQKKEPATLGADAPPPDARAELWGDGLALLRGLTGKPDGPSRGLLGRLVKAARDDCPAVMRALRTAADLRPIDPVPWLMAALNQPDDDTRLLQAAGLLPTGPTLDGDALELFPRVLQ